MKIKLSYIWIILVFAFLHAICCFACRTMNVEDEHVLTLLTIAMTFILCYQRDLKFFYTIAAVILVNVLAYMIGNSLPKFFYPLLGNGEFVHSIATFMTTLFLGLLFELVTSLLVKTLSAPQVSYRKRWLVHFNERIIPVETEQIAYFFSENKSNYLVTKDGNKYVVDSTIDSIMADIDPKVFFRINRGCIISLGCVESATKESGRYKVQAKPDLGVPMLVTRSRIDEFVSWLE